MRKAVVATAVAAATVATGVALYKAKNHKEDEEDFDIKDFHWEDPKELTELDKKVYELAKLYAPDALKLLAEIIRIPADYYDQDPLCGTSNHETQRLDYLKKRIVELGAVLDEKDVDYDAFGSLVWTVADPDDDTPEDNKRVIFLDGHSDTVYPLRDNWHEELGEGIDCFDGLKDASKVNEEHMRRELNYIPPKDKWDQLLFGRGSADQLQGVVSQVFATKILLETRELGSLKGAKIVSIATIAEEDNDGGAPMHIMRKQNLQHSQVPDCVVITEGTGDLDLGPCGIYIGQRGRCQVQVEVIGKSCHGSMPHMGINPLEYGSMIIAEAAEQAKNGFKDHKFLSKGTRTASWCNLETPSDCAVPAKFTFRFDRRYTKGEDADMAIQEIESLKSVKRAREAGCEVNITIPMYTGVSHKGVAADNKQDYMSWVTYPTDPVVNAAVDAYKRCVTPYVEEKEKYTPDDLRKQPRVQRWIFSTDGVGYPLPKDNLPFSIEGKNWTTNGKFVHPPMFGIGAGYEHHCHKLGEYLHREHIWCPIAVMARFPSLFVAERAAQEQQH
ncbi:Clan MH, family M20, peptidase T-like metallopeptidase [Histomonas meleagridis]|uniref:Clan MH, family M20, peptidase T-like metallopeptidase n=1 Tax=Histomonas meleagridis TaxID=135588 RepID=UPI00355A6846|nr:Clan MH, family M20, peptidase T-like metallopeptidase [Histomonas meleagridis]KAH0804500.1 Clan MH, family M20, peptidase T-like metallopeptidase [Histomonas meleagridis]